MNLYEARDTVANGGKGRTIAIFADETDGRAVRNTMPNFWRYIEPQYTELYKIGTWNDLEGNGAITLPKEKIDMQFAAEHPEVKAENESKDRSTDYQTMQKIQAEIENNQETVVAAAEARNVQSTENF